MHKNTQGFLHPSEGILASRKWECAVLITTKNAKKVENLSGAPRSHAGGQTCDGAPVPAAFLNAGGMIWQSIVGRRGQKAMAPRGSGAADHRQEKP
jgi:hypothetical protein